MKVLVTGGRDFSDQKLLERTLLEVHAEFTITAVIHGGSRGADRLAGQWAQQNDVEEIVCKADWKRYGRGAGFAANRQMLVEHNPDVIVAFQGGKGTAHMVALGREAGIKVLQVSSVSKPEKQ